MGFSNVALLGSKPPPHINKSVLPVWRYRATPATRSCTLFWGEEGKRKKLLRSPDKPLNEERRNAADVV